MWWSKGNTLALVELLEREALKGDSAEATLNSHLIGAGRAMGISDEKIRDAFDSDRMLVIYEP